METVLCIVGSDGSHLLLEKKSLDLGQGKLINWFYQIFDYIFRKSGFVFSVYSDVITLRHLVWQAALQLVLIWSLESGKLL